MLIYANGDSFTAGDELAVEILPGFPGYTSIPPTNFDHARTELWMKSLMASSANKDIFEKYLRESKQLSYPYKVGNLLNCQVINNAQGGSSFDRIARRTIIDLINIKENFQENIIAIIGNTSIYRIELPYGEMEWAQTSIYDKNYPIPAITEYFLRYYSDYHALLNFYKNIILIKEFCASNKIRLILVNAIDHNDFDKNLEFNKVKNYVDLKYDFNMAEIASKVGGKIFCPSGHFAEPVHTRLAEEIIKII